MSGVMCVCVVNGEWCGEWCDVMCVMRCACAWCVVRGVW